MSEQRSTLHTTAATSKANFVSRFGWELTQSYGDVSTEYIAARDEAAIYDSSYIGRLKANGEDALDLLHRLSTNDLLTVQPGQGAPTVLTTDRGRILDLLTILNLGDQLMLLTSPQTRETVAQWIDKYTIIEDVIIEDATLSTAMLSVIGPGAGAVLGGLVNLDLSSFEPYQSAEISVSGVIGHVVRRDLISLPRYELIVPFQSAEPVWQAIVSAGVVPIGIEAYEMLRVEEGEPQYGGELGEAYNPLETGLWGSISFDKGCYIGQEVIARLDTYQKVQKHLVSLSFSSDAQVAEGAKLAMNGKEVGLVTSVVKLPTTSELIGMGYVRKEAAESGTKLSLSEKDGPGATVVASLLPLGLGE